jgi:hypothetical protein
VQHKIVLKQIFTLFFTNMAVEGVRQWRISRFQSEEVMGFF